jgi:hypothetical protein
MQNVEEPRDGRDWRIFANGGHGILFAVGRMGSPLGGREAELAQIVEEAHFSSLFARELRIVCRHENS